jgi:hypothetical protein
MPTWTTLKDAGRRFAEDQFTDRAAVWMWITNLALLMGAAIDAVRTTETAQGFELSLQPSS